MKKATALSFQTFRQWIAAELVVTIGEIHGSTILLRAEDDVTKDDIEALDNRCKDAFGVDPQFVPSDSALIAYEKLINAMEAADE